MRAARSVNASPPRRASALTRVAFPPDRLLRVARGLDARGARVAVGSLCQDRYDSAFASFLEALSR